MKNVNFVPKDVQRILSSHKILEKYNGQKVFHKKAVLKNFGIFTGKYLCWSVFFNKKAGLQVCSFIKKRVFKNTYFEEHLWTAASENFPWTFSYINKKQEVKKTFSQKKKTKKTVLILSYMKKTCLYMMFFMISFFLYFSTARQAAFALHNKRW